MYQFLDVEEFSPVRAIATVAKSYLHSPTPKNDLKKAWLTSGVDLALCESLLLKQNSSGRFLSKRELMDCLYEDLRKLPYERRLEISRNFTRILIERTIFEPQKPEHRIEIAKNCSIRLRELYDKQKKEREYREQIRRKAEEAKVEDYFSQLLKLRERFGEVNKLSGAERGYALEKLFTELMKVSAIPVEEPFRIIGEQIDGAIKYDGHYYLIELKWIKDKVSQNDFASLRMKVDGKMESRGLFIAMNGYSNEAVSSLTRGKSLMIILLDGVHLANVIYGIYTFQELLEHAIRQACLKGEVFCSHSISPT